jgi:hypothetical protein
MDRLVIHRSAYLYGGRSISLRSRIIEKLKCQRPLVLFERTSKTCFIGMFWHTKAPVGNHRHYKHCERSVILTWRSQDATARSCAKESQGGELNVAPWAHILPCPCITIEQLSSGPPEYERGFQVDLVHPYTLEQTTVGRLCTPAEASRGFRVNQYNICTVMAAFKSFY